MAEGRFVSAGAVDATSQDDKWSRARQEVMAKETRKADTLQAGGKSLFESLQANKGGS